MGVGKYAKLPAIRYVRKCIIHLGGGGGEMARQTTNAGSSTCVKVQGAYARGGGGLIAGFYGTVYFKSFPSGAGGGACRCIT